MEKVIDKIRKVLAHAESARAMGSIAEAEIYARKVQQLLNEYNLSRADLTEDEVRAEIIHDTMPLKVPGIGGRSSFDVMSVVAKFNWCKAYTMGNASENKMIIVGSPDNIEVCKYIHAVVMPVFLKVGKEKYKEYARHNPTAVGQDTFMRTFLKGCADGLYSKFKAEREEFEKANESSTAIIRTNEVVIVDYVTMTWGGSGTGRKTNYSNAGGAYSSGKETGKSVTINKAVTGTSKPVTRKMLN